MERTGWVSNLMKGKKTKKVTYNVTFVERKEAFTKNQGS
jgi:hypothetical protein